MPTEGSVKVQVGDPPTQPPLEDVVDMWVATHNDLKAATAEQSGAAKEEAAATARREAADAKVSRLLSEETQAFEAVQTERAKAASSACPED